MNGENILIIGAGASGLMAARELTKAGKRVTVLEAKEKTGGRVLDVIDPDIPVPVMLGAEFVHGNLNLTFSLLKEAGIGFQPISGKSYSLQNGQFVAYDEYSDYWPDFIEKLKAEKEDSSLTAFLNTHFADDKYDGLRNSVTSLVQGYDAADPDKVSLLSLQKEWQQDENQQYRIDGGYGKLIDFLEHKSISDGAIILTNKVVSRFNWSQGFVEAVTLDGQRFVGEKAIITLPLGVLQIKDGSLGAVNFTPPLPIRMEAVRAMGYGSVIKIVLCFTNPFWLDAVNDAGFIFSQQIIPIWWTQLPDTSAVLTGWLAGPEAEKYQTKSESELTDMALQSLSNLFHKDIESLKLELVKAYALNWAESPFSRGAYAYTTVSEPNAHSVLSSPVQDTLYFSGEATYEGAHGGTVEAALVSGMEVSKKVLQNIKV